MSAKGQSRHFDRGLAPSGPPRSTDIVSPPRHVELVPKPDSCSAANYLRGRLGKNSRQDRGVPGRRRYGNYGDCYPRRKPHLKTVLDSWGQGRLIEPVAAQRLGLLDRLEATPFEKHKVGEIIATTRVR